MRTFLKPTLSLCVTLLMLTVFISQVQAKEPIIRLEFVGEGNSPVSAWNNAKHKLETEGYIKATEFTGSYLGVNISDLTGEIKETIVVDKDGSSKSISARTRTVTQTIDKINVRPPVAEMQFSELREADLITQMGGKWICILPTVIALDDTAYQQIFHEVKAIKSKVAEAHTDDIQSELEALESPDETQPKTPSGKITGIIIDASQLNYKMNAWPAIYGKGKKKGWDIYSVSVLNDGVTKERPYVVHAYSVTEARQLTDRIGTNPVVIEAKKAFSKGNQDLLLTKADASLLVTLDNKDSLLKEGRVVIVVKAK